MKNGVKMHIFLSKALHCKYLIFPKVYNVSIVLERHFTVLQYMNHLSKIKGLDTYRDLVSSSTPKKSCHKSQELPDKKK